MPVFRALVFRRPLVPKLMFGVLMFGVLMSCLAVFGAQASRGPAASLVP